MFYDQDIRHRKSRNTEWFCHTFIFSIILILFLLQDTLMMVTEVAETC
jgi:hypothetical protein